eukprot:scaffold154102_cov19-Prasinocladus_malaysianus.AAC.1
MDMTTAGMEWEVSIYNHADICKGKMDIAEKAVKYVGSTKLFEKVQLLAVHRVNKKAGIDLHRLSGCFPVWEIKCSTYLESTELLVYRNSALQKDRTCAIASHDNR